MKFSNKIAILIPVFAAIGCSTTNTQPLQHNLIKKNIYCGAGLICDIELTKGESINDIMLSDSFRWKADIAYSGKGSTTTPHIIVKPLESNLSSNLLVYSSYGTYSLALISRAGSAENIKITSDYYVSGIAPSYMTPVAIFEDGSHVYIQMPPAIVNHNLPAFFAIDEDGKYRNINYHYESDTYTIDSVFDKGVLTVNKSKLFITKKP